MNSKKNYKAHRVTATDSYAPQLILAAGHVSATSGNKDAANGRLFLRNLSRQLPMDDSGSEDDSRMALTTYFCDTDVAKLPVYNASEQPSCVKASRGNTGITYVDAFEDTVCDNISSAVEYYSDSQTEDDDDVGSQEAEAETAESSYHSVEASFSKQIISDQPVEDWDAEIESTHPYGVPTPYVHKDHQQPNYNKFTYGKETGFPKFRLKKVPAADCDVCEGQFDDA